MANHRPRTLKLTISRSTLTLMEAVGGSMPPGCANGAQFRIAHSPTRKLRLMLTIRDIINLVFLCKATNKLSSSNAFISTTRCKDVRSYPRWIQPRSKRGIIPLTTSLSGPATTALRVIIPQIFTSNLRWFGSVPATRRLPALPHSSSGRT